MLCAKRHLFSLLANMASMKESHIERLTGSQNYNTWSVAIRSLLEYHDMEKCIEATSSDSTVAKETDPERLKKSKARIILSIDKHLYVHVQNCTSAIGIWSKLRSMYEDKGLSRRISLLRKLIACNLENCQSMDQYISDIVGTANKLNSIGFAISEEWIGSILLAGLTDKYKPFIMAVENSGATITGDSIKTKLCEMSSMHSATSSSKAFFGKKKYQKSAEIICYECKKSGHFRRDCSLWKRKQSKSNQNKQPKANFVEKKSAFSAFSVNSTSEVWFVDSGVVSTCAHAMLVYQMCAFRRLDLYTLPTVQNWP